METGRGAGHLWLVSPTGRPHPVGAADAALLWSPDGTRLAYRVTLPYRDTQKRSDALFTVSITDGAPTRRFVATHSRLWPVLGWPTGQGVVF